MAEIESIAVPSYEKVGEQDCITPLEIFKGAALVVAGQTLRFSEDAGRGCGRAGA